MLQGDAYIRMSLELNLFFLRIMKEHSIFLKAAIPAKNAGLIETAGYFIRQFEWLLQDAVALSDKAVSAAALNAGQFFTPYTHNAEQATQYYTGIMINSNITRAEEALQPGAAAGEPGLEERVGELNQKAMASVTSLAAFKKRLLSDVTGCRLFMNMYPLMVDHMLREAVFYGGLLLKLQNRAAAPAERSLADKEAFWNRITAEHAEFVRGMLDPTQADLIDAADGIAKEFQALAAAAARAQADLALLQGVTEESLKAMQKVKDFNTAGTSNILNCKTKSIILPLLADHVLREANHYIFMLQEKDSSN